jgi:hypothetical protein
MVKRVIILRPLIWIWMLCISLSGCTVTETLKDALGSTKDFLSSTTPGDWFTGDGLLKGDQKVNAFVAINFENLKQDMAKGHGEYLTSLSELYGVPHDSREAYFSYAQSRYQSLNNSRKELSEVVALLKPQR